MREVDEHAEPVHLAHHLAPERARARRATGTSVAESAHGDVVVVRQGQVAHAEHVQHPQRRRASSRSSGRPRRPSSEAIRPARRRPLDLVGGPREGQLGRHTVAIIRWTASTCSSVALTAASPCSVLGHEDRPELGADPALAQPGQVGVRRGAAGVDVEAVEVVAGLLARLPRAGRCARRRRGAREQLACTRASGRRRGVPSHGRPLNATRNYSGA